MAWKPTKPKGNVISSYRSTIARTYTCNLLLPDGTPRKWTSLSIINESFVSSLTFIVNNMQIRVLPRGTFDDDFEEFDEVEVLNNVTHSIVMRG